MRDTLAETAILAVRVAGWACVVALVILSWLPDRPHTGFSGLIEHVMAYAGTAGLLGLGYKSRRGRVLVGLIVLAAILETGQLWVPGREATLIDFAASSTGAWLGIFGSLLVTELW